MKAISPDLKNLLDAIGKYEAPRGYGQIYGGAKGVPKDTDVSAMTLRAVQALQAKMVKNGSASTACGRYQFIRKTLAVTIQEMDLTGKEVWAPALQDQMAVHLIEKRGLSRFMAGKISRETFANNLAMEWASLPVVTAINGKKVGQSYYAGDGLNKSHHKPAAILALVDALRVRRAPEPRPDPVAPAPEPELAESVVVGEGSPEKDIKELQKLLNDRDYDAGPVDGKWGKLTKAALLVFKDEHDLDTADPSIDLEVVRMAGRRVIPTRVDATVADMRRREEPITVGADKVQTAAVVTTGGAAVVGGGQALSGVKWVSEQFQEWKDALTPFTDAAGLIAPVGGWLLAHWYLPLAGLGGVAIFYAHRTKQRRLEEFKSGKVK